MYLTATLARHRVWITVVAAMFMVLAFVPQTFAQVCDQETDPFCLGVAKPESLGNTPLIGTITAIINVALGLLGIIAVVIILYAGFQWMTAGGNEEKVTEAKSRITQGVIGLAIILSAYAIANFVINQLGRATNVEYEEVTG